MLRKVLQESPLIPRPIRHTLQKSQAISHISSPEPGPHMPSSAPSNPTPVKTSYTCNTVDIPPSFLLERADDSQAITATRVDFDKEGFPEYAGRYAVLLENVLSPSECKHLLKLAEDSAIADDRGRLWRPAMLNIGGNFEVAAPDTRNNDRIIWDSQQMIDRIWDRCLQAQGLKEDLLVIDSNPLVLGEAAAARGDRWRFTRPNERMRFLRYRDGQFFDRHCDGSYETGNEKSHYTLHLYLSSGSGVTDGYTTFYSRDMFKTYDVKPVVGRVLIFQHRGLIHSGGEVTSGEKFTMRTDLMYERMHRSISGISRADVN